MKISKKVTGLALAGVATAGAATAAIAAETSSPSAGNVSQNRHYTPPRPAADAGNTNGRTPAARPDADEKKKQKRHRPPVVRLTNRYAVVHVRQGGALAVSRKSHGKWRIVGTLRWSDRNVMGRAVSVRKTTTIIAVVGDEAVRLCVPRHAVIVVADNGRVGVVPARYLMKAVKKTMTMSPTPTTPPMTPPAGTTSPTPAPTGSQAPVVGGLKGRVSPKW